MTAKELIGQAAQEGTKLWWKPLDKAATRLELTKANGYLIKIANVAMQEANYYKQILVESLAKSKEGNAMGEKGEAE